MLVVLVFKCHRLIINVKNTVIRYGDSVCILTKIVDNMGRRVKVIFNESDEAFLIVMKGYMML